jgi:hypothetical protein
LKIGTAVAFDTISFLSADAQPVDHAQSHHLRDWLGDNLSRDATIGRRFALPVVRRATFIFPSRKRWRERT